jgi:hypothetical protein
MLLIILIAPIIKLGIWILAFRAKMLSSDHVQPISKELTQYK